MSNTKFTPGPWKKSGQFGISIGRDHGYISAQNTGCFYALVEEREANAALIAAAPDLYDALEQAAEALSNCKANTGYSSMQYRAAIAIKSALEKARGE